MDESKYESPSLEDDFLEGSANKKYTFFVVDANPAMFEKTEQGDCDFRVAMKLILDEMVRVCCSRSLNNHIGVIVAGTSNSNTEGMEHCQLIVPMGVAGQEEVNEIKDIWESKDEVSIESMVPSSGGYHPFDVSNVLYYCKRVFSSCPNTRHQSVIYLTDNRNPFGRDNFWDSAYFKRTKSSVEKIIGQGNRKTLGEFSVILLPEDRPRPQTKKERDLEPWYQLDSEVFTEECDAAARIRQKITAQRSHANLKVTLGPGVAFDVSVFSMVMEARPLDRSNRYTYDTEEKIVKTSGYVTREEKGAAEEKYEELEKAVRLDKLQLESRKQSIESSLRNRKTLKKSIEIGGQQIILDGEQYDLMNELDAKGFDVIGFVPLNRVDREISIISPKIIQPNEQTTIGSTRIYRSLLDRCWARQQAIVCKYQSRSKQKMRIVALIPFKKDMTLIEEASGTDEDGNVDREKKPDLFRLEQQRAQADASEWLHEGFMLIGLPYNEELRDDFHLFEAVQHSQHNTTTRPEDQIKSELETMKKFVKRLTMSYNPSFYENPRLLSERSALCLEATGEEIIERKDTLQPYYAFPERLARVSGEIEEIIEKFEITENEKKGKKEPKEPASKGRKRKEPEEAEPEPEAKDVPIREIIDELGSHFLLKDLISMATEHCGAQNMKARKKQDVVDFIEEYLNEHPNATWNVELSSSSNKKRGKNSD